MEKGTLKIKFSNGFGNNLFQYCFGRLLSEFHDLNYSHPAIPQVRIKEEAYEFNPKLPTIRFKARSNLEAKKFDTNHHRYFKEELKNCNYDFSKFMFYFEDYTLYENDLDRIRSWFPEVKKTNTTDLVLHLRLENRIIQETHYKNAISPLVYRDTMLSNFNFDKLYLVTDTDKWGHIDKKDVEELHFKYRNRGSTFISIKKSIKYMNSFVDAFKEFKPSVVHHSNFIEDFDFIRSFDQIMFKNSTFAWWAATLSDAAKIGVFKSWKPNKGERNKNLGKTSFPGWFGWE